MRLAAAQTLTVIFLSRPEAQQFHSGSDLVGITDELESRLCLRVMTILVGMPLPCFSANVQDSIKATNHTQINAANILIHEHTGQSRACDSLDASCCAQRLKESGLYSRNVYKKSGKPLEKSKPRARFKSVRSVRALGWDKHTVALFKN